MSLRRADEWWVSKMGVDEGVKLKWRALPSFISWLRRADGCGARSVFAEFKAATHTGVLLLDTFESMLELVHALGRCSSTLHTLSVGLVYGHKSIMLTDHATRSLMEALADFPTLRHLRLTNIGLITATDLATIDHQCGWHNLPRQLQSLSLRECHVRHVPEPMLHLEQLTNLELSGNHVSSGWEHLPRELRELSLSKCALKRVPAELETLAHLTRLDVGHNGITGGWEHLPRQLRVLHLPYCTDDMRERVVMHLGTLRQVPAALAALTALEDLRLHGNLIQEGWDNLPATLQRLDLCDCGLGEVPAPLGRLARLTELKLSLNGVRRGWDRLPRQLRSLGLYCATGNSVAYRFTGEWSLEEVPAALTALTELEHLDIGGNKLQDGWDHMPPQLRQLSLTDCHLESVPAALETMGQLTKLSLNENRVRDGWDHLPRAVHHLDLASCELEEVPAALAAMTNLQELRLDCNRFKAGSDAGWGHVPHQTRRVSLKECRLDQVPDELANRKALTVARR